jgi:predicted nuclease of predicted toxin-antitoxin system
VNLLLDMNLSPALAGLLSSLGHDVVHWSEVGDYRATDVVIMAWAKAHERVLVTHDLDFGAMLADTEATGPSVIQIRVQDLLAPETVESVVNAIEVASPALARGAIVTIHEDRSRIRILPLRSRSSNEG